MRHVKTASEMKIVNVDFDKGVILKSENHHGA